MSQSNVFANTLGNYKTYPNTKFGEASGTFQAIKDFLETDNIQTHNATIKYTSCINFISENLYYDSPIIDDKNIFEELMGKLKFDYYGSDEELKELFNRYNLEYIE